MVVSPHEVRKVRPRLEVDECVSYNERYLDRKLREEWFADETFLFDVTSPPKEPGSPDRANLHEARFGAAIVLAKKYRDAGWCVKVREHGLWDVPRLYLREMRWYAGLFDRHAEKTVFNPE